MIYFSYFPIFQPASNLTFTASGPSPLKSPANRISLNTDGGQNSTADVSASVSHVSPSPAVGTALNLLSGEDHTQPSVRSRLMSHNSGSVDTSGTCSTTGGSTSSGVSPSTLCGGSISTSSNDPFACQFGCGRVCSYTRKSLILNTFFSRYIR